MPSFRCPVCQQRLSATDKQWRCANNHSFDVAKEGYLNLLLANKKKTRDPGDNAEMMQHRRRFLESGAYQFLPARMSELLGKFSDQTDAGEALDLGSGEGYYTAQLQKRLTGWQWHGLDISKPGVRMAAKRYPNLMFSVASSHDLPLEKKSQRVVTQVFAPANIDEVCRVLVPGGVYITVNPGPEHLWELKQHLYDTPHRHKTEVLEDGRLEMVAEEVVSQTLSLSDQKHMLDLFVMTPYYWNVGYQRQQQLQVLEQLETTASFHIAVYRRKPDSPGRYWEVAENSSSTG